MKLAYYDPLLFKWPKGPVKQGTKVKFKIEVDANANPKSAYFIQRNDGQSDCFYEEMTRTQDGFEFEKIFETKGHFWYRFKIVFDGYEVFLNKTYDNYSNCTNYLGEEFLQLVTAEEYKCTNSMQGGIIYQILVDRFCKVGEVKSREPMILRDDWGGSIQKNTTDPIIINLEVFGGNFKGIISKLDYIESLGITTIYLNPISLANSNHKYNTTNYMEIDDMYGTEEDFQKLVDCAKQKGIQIVIDGVYNHTGSDSIYFNKENRFNVVGAYNSKDSKYYSWYDFYEYPDGYRSWWGIDTLPSIRAGNEEFQQYITGDGGVLDKFLKIGVGGVRLDVVDEINDEFVKKIQQRVSKYGENRIIMGEVWEDAATKESYGRRREYFSNNELNSVMNYPFKETILEYVRTGNLFNLVSTIRMIENNYPKVVKDNLMNFLSTHDTGRIFSELLRCTENDNDKAQKLYKIATIILYTLPGVPSIFYGDEYGMENNSGSSRGCFDWQANNNAILEWFKKLKNIRQTPVLKDGEINILYAKQGKFVFERTTPTQRMVVCTNTDESVLKIDIDGEMLSLIDGKIKKQITLNQYDIEVLLEKK